LAFAALCAVTTQSRAADVPPPWAFAVNPPVTQLALPVTDDGLPKHVAGSSVELSLAQVKDPFNIPDWHPDNHPSAPDIVPMAGSQAFWAAVSAISQRFGAAGECGAGRAADRLYRAADRRFPERGTGKARSPIWFHPS
jgi:hypothetical protein